MTKSAAREALRSKIARETGQFAEGRVQGLGHFEWFFRNRHSRADTTANEYMQELPESVQPMVGTVYAMLTAGEGTQTVN